MSDERKNDEQVPPYYEMGLPILPGPADREKAERARDKEDEREYKKDQTSIQRGILITQALLVFFGVVGAGISYYQATTARQSAEQAKLASDLASDSFEVAYGEKGISERTMSQTIHQTAAQIQSAKAAEIAIAATRDQMRLDERAWVVLRGIGPAPQLDQPWTLNGVFTNTGKTPARTASWYCVVEFEKDEASLKWYRLAYARPTILAPNDQKECVLHPTPLLKVNQALLDQLKNPKTKLFVYGASIYQDIFEKWHWLTFCQQMDPDGSIWVSCDKGNDTGDGRYPPPPFRGPPTMSTGATIQVPP